MRRVILMMRLKSDLYLTLEEWAEKESTLSTVFASCDLFNGTIQRTNSYGQLLYLKPDAEGKLEVTTTVTDKPYYYPDLQLGSDVQEALLDQMMLRYEDRYLALPYISFGLDVSTKSLTKVSSMVRRFCMSNRYKYLNLLDTMYYDYNPIDNYNGVEESSTTRTPDLNYSYGAYEDKNTSSTTTTQDLEEGGITTEHYTTTYDDDTKARLQGYDVTTGKDISTVSGSNSATYGERNNYETGKETTDFKLKKSGNLGVTSTQKMIGEQRDISRFNILDEFFAELADYICLGVY